MKIAIVAAVSRNGVIGNAGTLPWRLPSDMRRFRELTLGHTVIMGRKTYESLPARFRPLPERTNIVMSRGCDFSGCHVARSFNEALRVARSEGGENGRVFVIGGEQVYYEALPFADELFITRVEGDYTGDAHFPSFTDVNWNEAECSELMLEGNIRFRFLRYKRIQPLYWAQAARTEAQRQQMQELENSGTCVFCPEWFAEHHRYPVAMDARLWYVTPNDYPYIGALIHLLIVPKLHVAALDELPLEAGAELFELIGRIKKRYQPPSEAIVIRSGDMRRNGGSVAHLHVHFIVGNTGDPDHKGIKFKVSSRYLA